MYGSLILYSFYSISNSSDGTLTRVLEGGVGQGERRGKSERGSEKAKHVRESDMKNYPSQMTSTGTALEATLL